MTWSQNYAPLGGVGVLALIAALPVVTLLGLLAFWHVRAQIAALAALFVAAVIAVAVYHMPVQLTLAAAVFGGAFGLFPIGWIILNAIFIYNLSVETGQFAVLQQQVAGVSRDRRIQALLIAFSFGAFIEGAAGFGAPIAISGALLIGLGFKPLEAARLALIGNTAPVAFGALGTPLLTLAKVTGLDLQLLSMMVGRQLAIFSVIVPFWLVAAQAGWRGMTGVWPACLVSGLSFAIAQFLMSNYHGPWLVGIVAAVTSMGSLVVLMRFWKPTGEQLVAIDSPRITTASPAAYTGPAWKAWLPWVFLTVFVFVWGLPPVKKFLDDEFAPVIQVPWLHNAVQRVPPVVAKITAEPAVFDFKALSATGTALLLAGFLAGLCLGLGPKRLGRIPDHQLRNMHKSFHRRRDFFGHAWSAAFMPLQRPQIKSHHINRSVLNPNSEVRTGSTGDPPVPSGHWPDGTGGTLALKTDAGKSSCAFPVPSGGSPLGTGQWPVPPTGMAAAASEFGLTMSVMKRHKCRAPVVVLPRCVSCGLSTPFFSLDDR